MPVNKRSITVLKILGGSIKIDLPSFETPPKVLEIQKADGNRREVLEKVGDLWLENIRRQFITEGKPDKWKPLKPATVAEKKRLGYGNKGILERTGTLKRGFVKVTTQKTMRIQNDVRVGRHNLFFIHELGAPKRKISARSMLQLTPRLERDVMRLLRQHYGVEDE